MFKKNLLNIAILGLLINPLQTVMAHHGCKAKEMEMFKKEKMEVLVPDMPVSNEFTLGALFLRPGGGNDYAVLVNPYNPTNAPPSVAILSPTWETKGINPNFTPGFLLNFRHVFANSGNDMNLYWQRLRTSANATFPVNRAAPSATQFVGPIWNIGPNAGVTSNAYGTLQNSFDQFNVEFGQHVNFGPKLNSRFLAGVSGLWMRQRISSYFSGTDPILGLYTFNQFTQSRYNAGGLRFGIDGEYKGMYNVNVVGLLAGDVFIGSQQPYTKLNGTGQILTNAGIPTNYQTITHNSYIQVVPALETKLGLKYSQQYSNDKSLVLEAGYMASVYVNAMQTYLPSTYVPGSLGIVSGSVFLQSLLKATNSFSLDGLYLTATLKM